jgi:hypothetical protein
LLLERREKARVESREVAAGVAESVALARTRGGAFEKEPAGRGARETPYRRMTGLEWLSKKGRLTELQRAAGERYGESFRRSQAAPSIGSTLEVQRGGNLPGGPSLAAIMKHAAGRSEAEARLERDRARLLRQHDLIGACDLVCGQELTPREAAGGEREAGRLEAVLKVALDILSMR